MDDTPQRSERTSIADGGRRWSTRRRFLAGGAAALASVATVGTATGRRQFGDAVVSADGNAQYDAIRPAIEAAEPGDAVCVLPGAYEGTVRVDVPDLKLLSIRPGRATIRDSWSDAGPVVDVAADGVTVQGFRVSNPDGRLGIAVGGGLSDVSLALNHLTDVGPFGPPGATGISVAPPQEGLTVAENVVESIESTVPEPESYPISDGIVVTAAPDGDEGPGLSDAAIRNNVVRDLSSEYACRGVTVVSDAEGVDVNRNDIYALSAANEDNEPKPYALALQTAGRTDEVAVERNLIEDVTASEYAGAGLLLRGDPGGLLVTGNDLVVPVGVQNETDVAVRATGNWWGDPGGPPSVDSNRAVRGDDGPGEQAAIVGPVTVDPWLTESVQSESTATNWYVEERLSGEPLEYTDETDTLVDLGARYTGTRW